MDSNGTHDGEATGGYIMKIAIILGTRPEIIRMSPIIRRCNKDKNYFVIHSGQHYSYYLDDIFFAQLELPTPKYNLQTGSGSHGEETGKMLIGIEKILKEESPDIVLVQGDTNTVLAGALAASKLNIKIGHVEAGVRSYDKSMPEEINRVITDHISDYLFIPTNKSKEILINEGIDNKKIYLTGNTIVDSLYQNSKIAENKTSILNDLEITYKKYFLVTIHRQENVDNINRLSKILKGLELVYNDFNLPILFPIHPRTLKVIKMSKMLIPSFIKLVDPVGFLEFLILEKYALAILTDSGGVQIEACVLRTPCVTLRDNTEWMETIEIGSNILAGCEPLNILRASKAIIDAKKSWVSPYGDGSAGDNIVNIISSL